MKSCVRKLSSAVLLILAFVAIAVAQAVPAPPPQPQTKPLTPLRVQVVISRYEGDKKVGSLPYILAVTANSSLGVSLRMGSQVPVPTLSPTGSGFEYKSVGTSIDSSATSLDDGRFQVVVRIEDSSVMERRSVDAPPVLRTFSASNMFVLRDGQTSQFTVAADKTTGEVVKVDVTLNVEK